MTFATLVHCKISFQKTFKKKSLVQLRKCMWPSGCTIHVIQISDFIDIMTLIGTVSRMVSKKASVIISQ